jgi:hypothetical protein
MNPDSFQNWWKRDTDKHNEREKKEKEKQLSDISKMVARLKTDNK